MNKEQKLELVNRFKTYYNNLPNKIQKCGFLYAISTMYIDDYINSNECIYLFNLLESEFLLDDIQLLENKFWLNEQIEIISNEN